MASTNSIAISPQNLSLITMTPFLTAPAGVQYFTGIHSDVTGVQPLSPGCTGMTGKSVGVHHSQPEMQNLVGVEIPALKSELGALQAHENPPG